MCIAEKFAYTNPGDSNIERVQEHWGDTEDRRELGTKDSAVHCNVLHVHTTCTEYKGKFKVHIGNLPSFFFNGCIID